LATGVAAGLGVVDFLVLFLLLWVVDLCVVLDDFGASVDDAAGFGVAAGAADDCWADAATGSARARARARNFFIFVSPFDAVPACHASRIRTLRRRR